MVSAQGSARLSCSPSKVRKKKIQMRLFDGKSIKIISKLFKFFNHLVLLTIQKYIFVFNHFANGSNFLCKSGLFYWRLKLMASYYESVHARRTMCFVVLSGRAWRFILLIGLVGAAGCLFQSVTLGHAQLAARWTETRAGGN
jgi:hypothetical protein